MEGLKASAAAMLKSQKISVLPPVARASKPPQDSVFTTQSFSLSWARRTLFASYQFQPHDYTAPAISIHDYLGVISQYANCSLPVRCCLWCTFIVLREDNPFFPINSLNVHRLLQRLGLVKFMDDIYYSNTYFARNQRNQQLEMKVFEVDFLFGLGSELNVTPQTFNTCCSFIHKELNDPKHQCTWQDHQVFVTV